MEYVEGITLDKYCKENGENNYTLYAQLFIKIANALYDIHEHNIVHRDIKPSNILVRKNGEPVIMDFGIAKSVSKDRTPTQDNQIVGTLHFMSPEQIRGKKLDGRSDIYSLGVMLYCIITEHFPFEDTSTFLIMKNIVIDYL